MKMTANVVLLTTALGLGFAGTTTAETTVVLSEPKVKMIVTEAGYAEPEMIVKHGEIWRVKTQKDTGNTVTLYVTPEGEIIGAAQAASQYELKVVEKPDSEAAYTPEDVRQVLTEAGFHNIHDVDMQNGTWKAEADDSSGEDYEIHIDVASGKIVHIEDD